MNPELLKAELARAINQILNKHNFLNADIDLYEGKNAEMALAIKTRSKASGMERVKNYAFLLETEHWTINHSFVHDGRLLYLVDCEMRDVKHPWRAMDRLAHIVCLSSKQMHAAIAGESDEGETEDDADRSLKQPPGQLSAEVIAHYAKWR
jgi:hypothetical protein